MTDVIMPQMGESIAEGTISLWLVEKGQYVSEDQPLVTVSTDKADVDIPSPASGVLAEIIADAGTTVPVGKLIARIDETKKKEEAAFKKEEAKVPEAGAGIPEAPGRKEGPAVPAKPVEGVAAAETAKEVEPIVLEGVPAAEAMRPPAPAEVVQPPPEIERPAPAEAMLDRSGFYSPAVMRLAMGHGIDLKAIMGTGEGGRVTKSDVMRVIAGAAPATPEGKAVFSEGRPAPEMTAAPKGKPTPPLHAPPAAPPTAEKPTETREGVPGAEYRSAMEEALFRSDEPEMVCIRKSMAGPGPEAAGAVPAGAAEPGFGAYRPPVYEVEEGDTEMAFSRLRRLIADHMVYSKRTSAHVTTFTEVDLDKIVGIRDKNKGKIKAEMGFSLTFLPFVMLAAVRTLMEFPIMNSVVQGDRILTKIHIHLGVAVDSERGLMVPVIREAEDMGLVELARAVNDLSIKVRDKKISPDELTGGTFTVSNPGRTGNLFGTPIISQPQVGVLRMGEVVKRPVVVEVEGEDAIVIRPMMYLSLSYDHRVVDGYTANQFLHRIKENLEAGEFTI
jgi:pyruvate/2-oxoglutarate dehydrogenase complex dihydrolipoamide acyltransferase (E2) component